MAIRCCHADSINACRLASFHSGEPRNKSPVSRLLSEVLKEKLIKRSHTKTTLTHKNALSVISGVFVDRFAENAHKQV